MKVFRVCAWPSGWTYADQAGQHRNGYGVHIGAWTYFLVWGPGPYLI